METWEIEEKAIKEKVLEQFRGKLAAIGLAYQADYWLCSETLTLNIGGDFDESREYVDHVSEILESKPEGISAVETINGPTPVVTFFHGVE